MEIIISNSSTIPIYEQVKHSITEQILDNTLKENEMIPSIRGLAKDLNISIMTVKKAYDELEKEHYITTIHGKGSFVAAKNLELLKEQKMKELEQHLVEAIKISKKYNIDKQELVELFNYIYEEEL